MNRRKTFILLAGVVFIGCDIAILTWWFTRTPAYQEPRLSFDGSSDQLQHTVIVPTLDTPIPEGKNAIWCASFQIAWNKLKADVAKGPVQIQGAEEIAKRLNDSPVTEADLPEGSYYAAAGLVRDGIVERIQKEMTRLFPAASSPEIETSVAPVAVAYGYLQSRLEFGTPYDTLATPLPFVDSRKQCSLVTAFGITPRSREDGKLWSQVEILGAKSEREFALELRGKDPNTQLVLARFKPRESLSIRLADLESLLQSKGSGQRPETLTIPVLSWRARHHFKELEGPDKLIGNTGLGRYLSLAGQDIQFRLDHRGAVLTSESKLIVVKAVRLELDFDGPFLIVLKKRTAQHPFFVMWVDNAELLQKWGE